MLTNYTYITNYYQLQQEAALFNVLQIALEKTVKVREAVELAYGKLFSTGDWQCHRECSALFTRNRIAYEGNLGFKNLDIAFGLEVRYHTPYKADNYSPVLGQFFYQDSITIRNRLPDISAYAQFQDQTIQGIYQGGKFKHGETWLGTPLPK